MGHVLAILGLAAAVTQAPQPGDELRRELKSGDLVSVTASSGETISGRLLRIESNDLVLRTAARTQAVPVETLQTLERRGDSKRNGAILGAIIGAATAGALFAYAFAIDRNEMDEWGRGYAAMGAAFTGVGAFVGWGLDAANSRPHWKWTRR